MAQAEQIERKFYVVISGVQTIYFIDRNGNKVVIAFSFDGSYSGVYESFTDGAPSGYFLEALTDNSLYYIELADCEQLFTSFNGFNKWGRIVNGELLRGRVMREIELSTLLNLDGRQLLWRKFASTLRQPNHSAWQEFVFHLKIKWRASIALYCA
ncbi:MAG: CRP-like cAMP-binding protein [Flavobacteriales bacterium]|jgi:CRP-like cAMP-binding protein